MPPPAATVTKKETPKKKGKNKVADAQPAEWHGLWPRVENDQYRTPHPYWKGALKLVNFVHFTTVVDPFFDSLGHGGVPRFSLLHPLQGSLALAFPRWGGSGLLLLRFSF